jgi:hypothetical protein
MVKRSLKEGQDKGMSPKEWTEQLNKTQEKSNVLFLDMAEMST